MPRQSSTRRRTLATPDAIPALHDPLNDIRLADILALLSVRRAGSLSGAARERQVTPSQISRAVARLERQLHLQILTRGSQGCELTETGERVATQLEAVVDSLHYLRRNEQRPTEELTIAGPSFLCSAFLPCLADCVPGLRVRAMEMAPALLRTAAPDGVFDVALTTGGEPLPMPWHNTRIGKLRKGLFAMPRLAARLGTTPVSAERLKSVPFINPVYCVERRLIPTDDGCPLHHSVRMPGHEVQTFSLGLELALCTEQLVFGPVLAARRFLERGFLVEIPVLGWDVWETLFVAHHGDRIKSKHQRAMCAALAARLSELSEPPIRWAPLPAARGPSA